MDSKELINDTTQKIVVRKKVRKLKTGPIIGIVIIVFIVTSLSSVLFAYNRFINDPEKIFTRAINIIYQNFHEYIKYAQKAENTYFNIEENSLSIEGNVNLDGTFMNFNQLDKTTFKTNYGLDYKNDLITFGTSIQENNTELIDAMFYFKGEKGYIESNTLFNNIYSTDLEENILKNIDIKELQDSLDGENYSINDLDNTIKSLKDVLIASLDKDSMSIEKNEIEVNDEKIKVNKISYKLNKESTKKLFSSFAKIILDDEELLKNLSKIFNIDKENLINSLKELMNDEFYKDFTEDDNMEFAIYTTGLTYTFVKIEITDKDSKLELINYREIHKVSFTDFKNNDIYELNVKAHNEIVTITLTYNKEQRLKFIVKEITEEKINIAYEIKTNDAKFEGILILEATMATETEMKGSIKFSCDMNLGTESYDLKVDYNYKILVGTRIETNKLDKAIDIKDFKDDDLKKVKETITTIESSNLYKYILDLLGVSAVAPENIIM